MGLKARKPSDIDMNSLTDGTYRGKAKHWPVAADVEVVVADKRIESITILRHRQGRGKQAEVITDHIIARQSLDVDVISGATLSSRTIIEAAENALRKNQGAE
jgi:uncharacterized protein with FMN-binding domain